MKSKILFETMDATEADLVQMELNGEGIKFQITGRTAVAEFQAVPIQIFVSEEDFQRSWILCEEKGLFKTKTRRVYSREEKQWLYYLASIFPICMIFSWTIKDLNKLIISTVSYLLLGIIFYQRYKRKK